MLMVEKVERWLSAALSIATIVGVALLVERRLGSDRLGQTHQRVNALGAELSEVGRAAVNVGSQSHGVEYAVFTDYECPICRAADSVFRHLEKSGGAKLRPSVIHVPLPGHRHALKASLSLHCAAEQGRASAMHQLLFQHATAFDDSTWSVLPSQAAIGDLASYNRCLSDSTSLARVQQSVTLGKRLGISGTPAYVIDGRLYDATLIYEIEKVLLDKSGKLTAEVMKP